MKKSEWVWMPHPGHFICAKDCRFHLNTYVGGYIVSTVGELLFDSNVREIMAESRGVKLKGEGDNRLADYMQKIGYEDLGYNRKYETMVFKAEPAPNGEREGCCPFRQVSGTELDMEGYNDPAEAFNGHMKLCEKWSRKRA